jgi:hypothetical protein
MAAPRVVQINAEHTPNEQARSVIDHSRLSFRVAIKICGIPRVAALTSSKAAKINSRYNNVLGDNIRQILADVEIADIREGIHSMSS